MENRCPPESVNSLLTPCAFKRLPTSRPPWKVCVSCSASRVADIDGDSTCSAPARALARRSRPIWRGSSRGHPWLLARSYDPADDEVERFLRFGFEHCAFTRHGRFLWEVGRDRED